MFLLRTGVPSVDELFHHRDMQEVGWDALQAGVQIQNRETTTSFCIAGPDGAGKSVLAMHLASRYCADCIQSGVEGPPCPQVFYVSTDLTHSVAKRIWANFGLYAPNARRIPFRHPQFSDELLPDWLRTGPRDRRRGRFDSSIRLELVSCPPDDPGALADRIHCSAYESTSGHRASEVTFVDLASRTAGDDWAFIHRLLAVLPCPKQHVPRHLMVIDAVEGLETFGGDLDAFGEKSPRRARIAKLMRLATGKCHVVLIVEEPAEGLRLPEQFVSDVVIRLRSVEDNRYMRRTIEIEKARGQPTVRGRHPYVIRSGAGSTTGKQPNWDDPELLFDVDRRSVRDPQSQSYMDAFPSIHYITRLIMEDRGEGRQASPRRCAGFGIHHLDEMLAEGERSPDAVPSRDRQSGDERGLPCSSVTALIGDAGTQKSGLGLAFLAQTFAKLVAEVVELKSDVASERAAAEVLEGYRDRVGVAVLLTTHDENHNTLSDYFLQHLRGSEIVDAFLDTHTWWEEPLRTFIKSRTICRRLEIHDSPPAVLLHTIRRTVEAAQQTLIQGRADPFGKEALDSHAEERFRRSWPIRLVIDDFNTILDTYAQARTDPLFLPFLLFYLRREGVTTLIEDTRPGGPYAPTEGFHTDLRALSDHRLYTWHVTDFFGDHRIAIAPIPPVAQSRRMVVRELVRENSRTDRESASRTKANLVVKTSFELYAGLEENKPRPVPLQVWLYDETDACRKYASYLNGLFQKMFTAHVSPDGNGTIVRAEPPEYDRLRDFAVLQGDTRLDYTLLFQVDEFWTGKRTFRREDEYLHQARVTDRRGSADSNFDDPYGTYRKIDLAGRGARRRSYKRVDFFDVPGCELDTDKVDRIPFARDYGFLVCRRRPWQDPTLSDEPDKVINSVWTWIQGSQTKTITWRRFLEAACRVAKIESGKRGERIPAFDLSMLGPESFSCLVLEVWLSEIYKTARARGRASVARGLSDRVGTRRWERSSQGLADWITNDGKQGPSPLHPAAAKYNFGGYSLELYKAWLLLIEALDLASLQNAPGAFGFKTGRWADPLAVASRRWYKTACGANAAEAAADPGPVAYCRLPGHFATRGDWFLAVASGSRSDRLANRALDLLCSERGNDRRLTWGIGLPARHLVEDQQRDAWRLATALRTEPGPGGRTLNYKEVLALGADPVWGAPRDFGWLWRSALRDYQSHAAAWHGWLYRVLRRWQKLRVGEENWISGFDVYDWLDGRNQSRIPAKVTELESFRAFPDLCADLVAELEAGK